MDATTYMEEFSLTLANTFFPEGVSPSWLRQRTAERLALAKRLKAASNSLFYGRSPKTLRWRTAKGRHTRRTLT